MTRTNGRAVLDIHTCSPSHPTESESRRLSGDKFPQLKRLRSEIERLYGSIKNTVSELMKVGMDAPGSCCVYVAYR